MQQDFLYCVKLMTYEAERSIKAQSSAEFATSTERVKTNADYSNVILATCTADPPVGLGIKDLEVLETRATLALMWYNQFQILCAQETDWVISLVAFVPCIQVRLLLLRPHGFFLPVPDLGLLRDRERLESELGTHG